MIKLNLLLILFLLVLTSAFGQANTSSNFKDNSKKYIDEAKFKRYQGVLLEDEAIIPGKNYDLGIVETDYYTEKDSFRVNFLAMFNPNFRKFTSLTSFEVMAAKNMRWFWLEGFFSATSADFGEITENRQFSDATVPTF